MKNGDLAPEVRRYRLSGRADRDEGANDGRIRRELVADVPAERVAHPVDRGGGTERGEGVSRGIRCFGDAGAPRKRIAEAEPRRVDEDELPVGAPASSSGSTKSQVWLSTNIDDHSTVMSPVPTRRTARDPRRVSTRSERSEKVFII
nr:hypothetical protein GCM10025699_05140 [Microbacterium flavescens]